MTTGWRAPAWARPSDMFDLVRLAGPVILSRASFMLMGLTDAVILARHAPGELPLVLNGWLPNGVFLGFGMGLLLGVQVLTAELNGSGKGDDTGRIFRRGLWVGLVYGIIATAACYVVAEPLLRLLTFEPDFVTATTETTRIIAYGAVPHMIGIACSFYLEALRRPNLVTAISLGAVLVNLVFDLWLVPQYGAVGVVWATTGSRVFMMVLLLAAALALTPALKPSSAAPRGEFLRQNSVGVGQGVANVAEYGSFNLTFVIATLVSIEAGTIYGLAVQMMGVVFMLHLGLGTATSVRVAENCGRRDVAGVGDASRLGMASSFLAGSILAVALLLLKDPIAIIWLNADDPQSAGAGLAPTLALMLAGAAAVSVFDGLQAVGSMALRAQGVVWAPTAIHIGSYAMIMVPLCWWFALPMGLGVWGVFYGITIASVIAGLGQSLLLEWTLRRIRREGLPHTLPEPVVG
ncbi:multidrug transporter [bacterium]|nr:multidrug transporter [bacterium]